MMKFWQLWNLIDEFRTLKARLEILIERFHELEKEVARLREQSGQ